MLITEFVLMTKNALSLSLAFTLCYLLLIPASSSCQEWEISMPRLEGSVYVMSDTLSYDREKGMFVAEGNVKITRGTLTLEADRVELNEMTNDVAAAGHVILKEGGDHLTCDRLELNLQTQKGSIINGTLFTREGNFYVTGERAKKLGERTYRVYSASFTTCDITSPDWKFTAKRVDITLEGYAVVRDPVFFIRGIPVFYFPVGIFPVKRERQTGFLIPKFGHSSKFGPEIYTAFYWAIAKNMDATFFLDRLGDSRGRGFNEGIEFRYALRRDTDGELAFYFCDDQVENDERWGVFLKHRGGIYRDFYAKANVAVISDDLYAVDFDEYIPRERLIDARTMRQLESTVFGGRNWARFNLLGEVSYINDLTVEEHGGTLQRLPILQFVALKQQLPRTPLYLSWENDYTRFWREEGIRGHRLDLHPKLSFPLMLLKAIRVEPEAGFRETLYLSSNDLISPSYPERMTDEFESREIPDFTVSTSTIVGRVYDGGWWGIERWKHQIEPEISYIYIPQIGQNDLPIFDELDRIDYTNAVTYGLTNTMSGRIREDGRRHTIRELLRFKVSQSYSFGEPFWREVKSGRGRYFSDIEAELWLNPSKYLNMRADLQYNTYKHHLGGFNVSAALSDRRGDALNLEYRYSRNEVDNIDVNFNVKILDSMDLFYNWNYNILENRRIFSIYGLDFRAQCWEIRFSVEDKKGDARVEDEIDFKILVTLTGVGSVDWK
ncbi:MAG: LPS-assembly protein LptD [Syntrophobacterales bacterium]|nr:MAG: LPS-assembly protein LptD [Syntrophobacterales bacterium]